MFVTRESPFSDLEWNDPDFIISFSDALRRVSTPMAARVLLQGAAYDDRVVHRVGESDEYYILIDGNGVPIEIWETKLEERMVRSDKIEAAPSKEGLQAIYNKVSESDSYYQNLRTILATEWVAPRCDIEGREGQIFHSTELLVHPFIILMGAPGAGKTSLVRRLAYDCAASNGKRQVKYPIPVYISLRSFQDKLRLIENNIHEQEESFGSEFIAPRRFEGGILYIFDGLDELEIDARVEFQRWLRDFVLNKPSLRVIVTSREFNVGETTEFKDFKIVRMLPFGRSQQYEYCHRVLSRSGNASQFLRVLEANPTTESFLTNPLSLSLALALFLVRGLLPLNVGEVAQEVVSQLTEGWDLRRGIRRYRHLNAPLVKSILGRLAAKLQANGGSTFSSGFLVDLMPATLAELRAVDVLEEIRDATGLIGGSAESWSFTHRYFQDFFCAIHLTERTAGLENELSNHADDSRWDGVWSQISDLCAEPEQFASELAARTGSGPKALRWTSSSLLSSKGITLDDERRLANLLTHESWRLLEQVELVQNKKGVRLLPKKESAVRGEDLLSMLTALQNLRFARRDELFLSMIQNDFVRSFFSRLGEMLDSGARPTPIEGSEGVSVLEE